MKKKAIVTAAVLLSAILAACGSGEAASSKEPVQTVEKDVKSTEGKKETALGEKTYVPETTTENQALILAEVTKALEEAEKNFDSPVFCLADALWR